MLAHRTLLLLLALSLLVPASCKSRKGDDDDDTVGGDGDADSDADGGGDPCPEFLCCPGKACPGGFLCTAANTCVSDPCGGADCCDDRPCEDIALECVAGQCVERSTIGGPCASDGDCSGPGAQCLFAAEGWPDGYCIQQCVGDPADCPGDGVCVGSSCFDGCFVPGDCRIGYDCIDVPGGRTCSPQ